MVPLLLLLGFMGLFAQAIRRVSHTMDAAGSGLAILSQVLGVIEREDFHTPMLAEIRRKLDTNGRPPSWEIAKLHRLIQSLRNSLQNQFFALFAFLMCLPVHLVHAIEVWRERVGPHIADWLEAVGEFEALSSLAGYAYEHPARSISGNRPRVSAVGRRAIGASACCPPPLCVRNDVKLDQGLAADSGQRLEHVRQKHAVANARARTSCWHSAERRCGPSRFAFRRCKWGRRCGSTIPFRMASRCFIRWSAG